MQDTSLWIFGYGSLIWNPGFEYNKSHKAYAVGFARRMYQGNAYHRGDRQLVSSSLLPSSAFPATVKANPNLVRVLLYWPFSYSCRASCFQGAGACALIIPPPRQGGFPVSVPLHLYERECDRKFYVKAKQRQLLPDLWRNG